MNSVPSRRNPRRLLYLMLIVLSLMLTLFLFVASIPLLGMDHGQRIIVGVVFMFMALVFFIRYQHTPTTDEESH
ncbi:hypothetical protein SAMN05421823_101562 [Catalinimonas alkaloidigena]|uniref:Uncharacterized protein n=1 Tax=Catalinimonas alkaloidigena TaxID=1075417 RepID=A0A1G8Y3Z0_9BACT|nr:hypothetical protein [Catalinimonas alkaloidigena]SDJ97501.1 hypothetical protein SAMN05421823_101562 [Catalinimonas alkaloidigena]